MNENSIFQNRIVIEQRVQRSFEEIKLQIVENKHEKVFSTLREMVSNSNKDLKNQLNLIEFRFNKWKSDELIGLSPSSVEFTKIIMSLLEYVDQLDEISKNSQKNQANFFQTFGLLTGSLNNSLEIISDLEPKLEIAMKENKTLQGKIWLAMIPQLKGTVKTIIKLLEELQYIMMINSLQVEVKNKYDFDFVNVENNKIGNFLLDTDIEVLGNLYNTVKLNNENQSSDKIDLANMLGVTTTSFEQTKKEDE